MTYAWVVIDRYRKSSAGAKRAKRNNWKYWPGAAFDTNNDVARTRVTEHNPQARLEPA